MTETITADVNSEYGTRSEEAVARLRSRIGKVMPIEKPYIRYINEDSITHFARAGVDQNPLYVDSKYAYAGEPTMDLSWLVS